MRRLAIFLLAIWGLGAGSALAERVTVFAAASLGAVLDEIAAPWNAATGGEVVVVAAGTSTLARQIDAGAPADVIVSANVDWMDWLEARDRLVPGSRVDLLTNRLVLVSGAPGPDLEIGAALDLGSERLAVALVDAVPAGIYAKAALEHFGLWAGLAPRVVQTDNVVAAHTLAARGAVGFAVVYASDLAAGGVHLRGVFPEGSHPPIVYPAALVAGAGAGPGPGAAAFLEHLRGPEAGAVFRRHGFGIAK